MIYPNANSFANNLCAPVQYLMLAAQHNKVWLIILIKLAVVLYIALGGYFQFHPCLTEKRTHVRQFAGKTAFLTSALKRNHRAAYRTMP
jgi:hypothetical protein